MTKRKYLNILLVFSMLLLYKSGTYAMNSLSITNPFETGNVKISLQEYEKNGVQEEVWKEKSFLLPADQISKIPRIQNEGCDCYIRARMILREVEGMGKEVFYGISDDWILADDGFYYYKKILSYGDTVEFFQGLKIPEDFSQENEGKTFYVDVEADAIQCKNFVPRFDMAAPWGNVEIISASKEGATEVTTYRPIETNNFQIRYEGNSEKFISNSNNFFEKFPILMPGDSYQESISFTNQGSAEQRIYFRSVGIADCMLSEQIALTITSSVRGKTRIVYKGPINGEKLSNDFLLASLSSEEEMKFSFEIQVPSNLNNQYSLLNSQVTWIFSTEPIAETIYEKVQTGDVTNLGLSIVCLVISLLLFSMVCIKFWKEYMKYDAE